MKLSSLSTPEIRKRLATAGISLHIGPFSVNLRSRLPGIPPRLRALYGDYPLHIDPDSADFFIGLQAPNTLRRWIRPQVHFCFDGQSPFKPLPQDQALAMFEWGLNWCIANNAHEHLNIHAAVVERHGIALLLPGSPGSGKSTLCAALVIAGWRLLSDEMALVSLQSGLVTPVPRPISLKNDSIDLIRSQSSNIFIGDVTRDTAKGNVAHMRAPCESVDAAERAVPAGLLVFPKYRAGSTTRLAPIDGGNALLRMAENSFNYNILGRTGFERLAGTVESCACYDLEYSNLPETLALLDQLIILRSGQAAP